MRIAHDRANGGLVCVFDTATESIRHQVRREGPQERLRAPKQRVDEIRKSKAAEAAASASDGGGAAAESAPLDAALDDADGVSALRAFCESEMSDENLGFVLAVRGWRAAWEARDDGARAAAADEIKAEFLADGAPKQVCVGQDFYYDEGRAMFDGPAEICRSVLWLDIWPRFADTDAGRAYIAASPTRRPGRACWPW